ncbi:hypothetical protein EXIGLDRAFT_744652 [Exidia glandulosa HHB12029]|uniref:Aminoglycoside phosphotransferase domain-containing protein n=1 Tax=Exidia glandulosa HHB12029 TaxID=1314781 RepID=A0A165PH54_EXIGL|nr:hypothetical protein EXIGLDRAFT_744652 [Exidia glandulosa HHB12029]
MRPSDTWKTVAELADIPFSASHVWPTLPLHAIERLAETTRSTPIRCVANRDKYASGEYNVVIELVFDDGVVWIARIWTSHYEASRLPADVISRKLRCEVATLKLVKARTTIPVPTVFGFSVTSDNPIGLPYVFMSPLPGRTAEDLGFAWLLSGTPIPPEKMPLFETYCASLADINLQLSEVTFDRIGSVYLDPSNSDSFVIGPDVDTGIMPCMSEAEFYAAYFDMLIRRAFVDYKEKEEEQDDVLFGLWLYSLFISTMSRSRELGPYRLCHRDLHDKNTLVDDSGRITGVLDWDFAACMPIEIFAADAHHFMRALVVENNHDQAVWFDVYQHALRHAEDVRDARGRDAKTALHGHVLSDLHASVTVQLARSISEVLIPGYWDSVALWIPLCKYMFGTEDWAHFQQSPIFKEWCTNQRARATMYDQP